MLLDGLSWRRTDERLYGRGYQGQYTTQDAESGYTAFDLRMYDTRYGRWLMGDPMRQHASGYVGMGNNPIANIDKDGGQDDPPNKVRIENGNYVADLSTVEVIGHQSNDGLDWARLAVTHPPTYPIFPTNYSGPNPYSPWQGPDAIGVYGSVSMSAYGYGLAVGTGVGISSHGILAYGSLDTGFNAGNLTPQLGGGIQLFAAVRNSTPSSLNNFHAAPMNALTPLLGDSRYYGFATPWASGGYSYSLDGNNRYDPNGYSIYSFGPGSGYQVSAGASHAVELFHFGNINGTMH